MVAWVFAKRKQRIAFYHSMNSLNSLSNAKEWDSEHNVFTVLVRHVFAMTL